MPGRVGLPEALPKQMNCSGHIFSAAVASTAIIFHLPFPRAFSILIRHWLLLSLWPLLLAVYSCSLLPFEEHACLGHGQPEWDEKCHTHNSQGNSIDIEVVQACWLQLIIHCLFKVQFIIFFLVMHQMLFFILLWSNTTSPYQQGRQAFGQGWRQMYIQPTLHCAGNQ